MENNIKEALKYAVNSIKLDHDNLPDVDVDKMVSNFDNDQVFDNNDTFLTSKKIAKLYLTSSNNTFDINHYLAIHKYLYDGISMEAGTFRKGDFTNRVPHFLNSNEIENELKRVLEQAKANIPNITNRDKLLTFIVKLYSDLDVIHPFTEGNGRTLREFMREYVDYICKTNNLDNYYLDYSNINKFIYVDCLVIADAFMQYEPLLDLFNKMLKVKENNINIKQA